MRIAIFSNAQNNVQTVQKAFERALDGAHRSVVENALSNTEISFVYKMDSEEKGFFRKRTEIAVIFEDCDMKAWIAEKIREKNDRCVVVFVSLGVKAGDYVASKIDDYVELFCMDEKVLELKAKMWLELAALRQNDMSVQRDSKGGLGSSTWARRTRFELTDESSLGLLWEFFLNDKRFDVLPYANNWIQACYSVSLRLLELGYKPSVIFSENDDSYFLTITSLPVSDKAFYGELVTYAQLEKLRFIGHTHAKSKGIFSLHILKHLSFDESKTEEANRAAPKLTTQTSKRSSYEPLKNPSMSLDSAKEYVRECGIDEEDLAELKMIDDEFRDEMDSSFDKTEWLRIYGKYFVGFSEAISKLLEFEDLQKIVADIGETMLSVEGGESVDRALFFADLVRQDLSLWFSHVFVLQDAQNIHYLDASLASSCYKIKEYLSPQTADATEDDGDDLELF